MTAVAGKEGKIVRFAAATEFQIALRGCIDRARVAADRTRRGQHAAADRQHTAHLGFLVFVEEQSLWHG